MIACLIRLTPACGNDTAFDEPFEGTTGAVSVTTVSKIVLKNVVTEQGDLKTLTSTAKKAKDPSAAAITAVVYGASRQEKTISRC